MKKNQYLQFLLFFLLACGLFLSLPALSATEPPININRNNYSTKIRKVTLYFYAPADTRQMKISNNIDFTGADWETYQTTKTWYLDYGAGAKTVYVRFKNKYGVASELYKDIIQLDPRAQMSVDFKINNNEEETTSRYAQLQIEYSEGVESMIMSNSDNFKGLSFRDVSDSIDWVLSEGSGEKIVYMQFKDSAGKTMTVSDKIIYKQPDNYIGGGSLFKGQNSTVYYLGYDGRLHPFVNSLIYHSWYSDFSNIHYVSDVKLRQYQVGEPVCARPGTWLIRFKAGTRVYAVEPGCQLRPLRSEAEAYLLYGNNWAKRVMVLDDIYQGGYHFVSYSAADKVNNIRDRDGDGLNSQAEQEYGTSDSNYDSDDDGLSDYEEINFWFSDPTLADTDKDGYKDGQEILAGYLPAGPGKLTSVPSGTYAYPFGAIVRNYNDNKLYYHLSAGGYYSAGKNFSDKLFVSNFLDERFIAIPPYPVTLDIAKNKKISASEMEIIYPTKLLGEDIVKL